MYRTIKTIPGSPTMFLLFLFLIYVTTTLLLVVAGAETSPHSEIKEAQKVVGHFLHDEGGTQWLSELAKTNSAPLSTLELMNAIRKITEKDSAVWKAATVLVDALESGNSDVTRPEWTMGDNENWKDLIDNIEMEDDIICLYRKSTNETTKKAEDWKQFLATVTPGYTVHLAIDTGIKYIICLKKLEEPIVHEQPSTTVTTVTNDTSEVTKETLAETPSEDPMKISQYSKSLDPVGQQGLQVTTDSQSDESDEECDDSDVDDNERTRPEDVEDYNDVDKERLYDDYDYKVDNNDSLKSLRRFGKMRRGMTIEKKIGDQQRNISPRKMMDLPVRFHEPIPEKIEPLGTELPECNRPIIFVLPNGNIPAINQEGFSVNTPFHNNLDEIWPFKHNPNKKTFPPYKPMNIVRNYPNPMSQQILDKWADGYKIPTQTHPVQSRYTHLDRNRLNQLPRKKIYESNVKLQKIDDRRHPSSNTVPSRLEKPTTPHTRINLPVRGSLRHDQWKPKSGKPHPAFRTIEKLNQAKNDYLLRLEGAKNTNRIGKLNKNPNVESDRASIHRFQTQFPKTNQQAVVKPSVANVIYPRYPQPPSMNQGLPLRFTRFPTSNFNSREPRLSKFPTSWTIENRSPCVSLDPVNIPWKNCPSQMPIYNTPRTIPLGLIRNSLPLGRCDIFRNCPMADHLVDDRVSCPTGCDKPIKLQIIVNGKVQEPFSFTVVTDPDQKVELSGPGHRPIPYGSRSLIDTGVPSLNDIFDTEEQIQESDEGFTQRNSNGIEESPISGTPFEHGDTEDEKLVLQSTSLGPNGEIIVDGRDIHERILQDTTTESSVSLETNGTTTTVNSTNIVG